MKTINAVAAAAALAFAAGGAHAASVTIATSNAGAASTSALAGFTTNGDDMDGMSVVATFGAASETATWGDTGANAGAATGTGFSLALSGDSFTQNWTLSNTSMSTLTGLTLFGAPGDTVFDRTDPNSGTAGSAQGRDFEDVNGPDGTIAVTYSRPVSLNVAPFVGDLYATLAIDFSGLDDGGILAGTSYQFRQDTDNLSLPGDINPIPLPAAAWMLMGGLAGLGAIARRKRSAV